MRIVYWTLLVLTDVSICMKNATLIELQTKSSTYANMRIGNGTESNWRRWRFSRAESRWTIVCSKIIVIISFRLNLFVCYVLLCACCRKWEQINSYLSSSLLFFICQRNKSYAREDNSFTSFFVPFLKWAKEQCTLKSKKVENRSEITVRNTRIDIMNYSLIHFSTYFEGFSIVGGSYLIRNRSNQMHWEKHP